jgi:hypothetical protein
MGFWKVLNIKEMQQLVHTFKISHGHVKTSKKIALVSFSFFQQQRDRLA